MRCTATSLLVLAGLLVPTLATAQDRNEQLGGGRHRSFESPQHFAFELRLGPYRPQIDEDPALGGKTPYTDTYGSGRRVLLAAELDWQVVRIPYLGTLGPGASIGYTSVSAKAKKLDGTESASDTTLEIVPIYGVAVLRADVFDRHLGVPLVPYAKLGIGLARWRSFTSGGTSEYTAPGGSAESAVAGKGTSWGTHVALGVAFDFNVLDRAAAKQLDQAVGVNHTYFYGELMFSSLNGFGSSNALRVGTSTWVAGLSFEF